LKKPKFEQEVEEYLELKSKPTRQTYGASFRAFLDFYQNKYGKDKGFIHFLDRIFEEFKKPIREQRRIAETELTQFIDYLKDKGKSNNSIRLYFAAMQNFLKYKQVSVSMSFIGNMPAPVEKKINGKHEWHIEQIKQFVDAASNYRDKAIILCMFQSGLAVNEICELNYGDIQDELETGILPLCLKLVRQKTSVEFKTFFGRDAVKYLKLYLETRKDLTSQSPLFTKERVRDGEARITPSAIQQSFSEIAKDLDFIKQNGGYNPARPHSLRAAFNSQLIGKIDETLREFWMGHAIGAVAKAYLNMPTEDLRKLYMSAEEFLKIEKSSREELDETAKAKGVVTIEMEEKVKALEKKVISMTVLEQKVTSLETLYNKLFEMRPEELRLLLQEIDRLMHHRQKEEDKRQFEGLSSS
jgi:site-specific recombinase XerC